MIHFYVPMALLAALFLLFVVGAFKPATWIKHVYAGLRFGFDIAVLHLIWTVVTTYDQGLSAAFEMINRILKSV